MRVATYNVEWFEALFDARNRLLDDGDWSGRHNVRRNVQIAALVRVFRALDADAVMIIEAPDQGGKRRTVPALEAFAAHAGIRARSAVMGFANHTRQEIALLYDPDRLEVRHDPIGQPTGAEGASGAPRFDGRLQVDFAADLGVEGGRELLTFSKPPLELQVTSRSGFAFRMIGAHLKSKAPHGARGPEDLARIAIANRRKQLAQALWLRRRIEMHLAAGEPVMVLGDLNDGPGFDKFEDRLGRSAVEIVQGLDGDTGLYDPHARQALRHPLAATPTTARFWIHQEGHYLQALLDYIMLSEPIRQRGASWRIWHPLDDPECWRQPDLREALVTASDHFPVTMDFDA